MGDELTFDYCSFTESEKEFLNSVCLCGSATCRGFYLSCTRSHFDTFKEAERVLLDNPHKSFLTWNAILLKSCVTSFDDFKAKELMKYSIGPNVFKNSPAWLRVWAFYILQEILRERNDLYDFYFEQNREAVRAKPLLTLSEKQRILRYNIESLFDQRIQNLLITLDKVLHFLDRQSPLLINSSPLVLTKLRDTIDHVCRLLRSCLRVKNFSDEALKTKVEGYLVDRTLPQEDLRRLPHRESVKDLKILINGKYLLLLLSEYFRQNSKVHGTHPALAEVLYFASMTKLHFHLNDFAGFEMEVDIRECDLTNHAKLFTKSTEPPKTQLSQARNVICSIKKHIPAKYIWAQLIFWNKQTLARPELHLEFSSRGTLVLPDLFDSFMSFDRSLGNFYPHDSRTEWLDSVRGAPGRSWGDGMEWSFSNSHQIYGTFLSDDFFLNANQRFTILEGVDSGIVFKLTVFNKVWRQLC